MIYSLNGTPLSSAYNLNGNSTNAYNLAGEKIFPDSIELKVMTYNVGGWYIGSGRNVPAAQKAEYLALQTGMIQAADPDVLCIQEYLANFSDDGTSALSMLQELFPYVHAKVSGTYFGRAICSKYPITNYVERTYAQESNRYFDSCTITVNGNAITFINTHLGLTQANRDAEIAQLIQYLNTLNTFICCGDFNTAITDANLTTTSPEYISNVKPFVDAGFRTANFGQFGFMLTCVDRLDGTHYYLDNEYTSSNITILDAYVDETKLTDLIDDPIDHMPLIATLQIGG